MLWTQIGTFATRRNPLHTMLYLLGQEDKDRLRDIAAQCTDSYLAAFIVAYTGGLLIGIVAVLRVMA